ncbi:MAG: glycosyltransferase family 39 protein, partial [Anaerolineales bacterium]|nr:glycosyltransferase family 39 protein [Anaerolineales bacterium]
MSRRRAAEFWLLVGVLALAGLLRGSGLAAQPLRGDEGFSVRFARLPLANMAAAFAVSEPNPPLQFLFLKGWLALAGESEFALRWPSVLAGLLGVAVVVPAGRALAGRRAARLAALWLALSPFLIWYS